MPRDPHQGHLVVERDDLAFEVVPLRIDDGHMLPRLQTEHARMLGILPRQPQRKHLRSLGRQNLLIQEKPSKRHKNLPPRTLSSLSADALSPTGTPDDPQQRSRGARRGAPARSIRTSRNAQWAFRASSGPV